MYAYIYMSPKHPYVFIASQGLPWESCFPLPSQMHEHNYPSVTVGSDGPDEGCFAVKGSEFDGRAGNRTQAASSPKSPS